MADSGFDLENHFISKVMLDADLTAITHWRITSEHFFDGTNRTVFEWITDHIRKHGQVPSAAMLKRNWPTYRLIRVEHGIDYYAEELRNALMHQKSLECVAELQDAVADRDVLGFRDLLSVHLSELAPLANAMTDINLVETWEERVDGYREARNQKGHLRGLSTGFKSIDRVTLGFQKKQFVVLVGLPKAGKSTILLSFAVAVHEANRRPLFIGFEMTNAEQAGRYDSMVAHVNHMDLLSGRMTRDTEKKLIAALEEREGMAPFMLSADVASATTVSGVGSKIDEHRPSAVFVDGLYLMDDERGEDKGTPRALTNITRDLKRLAQLKDVPIIGTTQVLPSKVTRTAGVQMSSVGYASSFAQDCDIMIAVEADDSTEELQRLKVLLNRSGPRAEIEVYWDWAEGTFEEIDEYDEDIA